jgi:hypothetical protein
MGRCGVGIRPSDRGDRRIRKLTARLRPIALPDAFSSVAIRLTPGRPKPMRRDLDYLDSASIRGCRRTRDRGRGVAGCAINHLESLSQKPQKGAIGRSRGSSAPRTATRHRPSPPSHHGGRAERAALAQSAPDRSSRFRVVLPGAKEPPGLSWLGGGLDDVASTRTKERRATTPTNRVGRRRIGRRVAHRN